MPMPELILSDPTLRDGNHAVAHALTAPQIAAYARAADAAGIPIVEVGHGNGLGASSLQVGLAAIDDRTMLLTAREQLRTSASTSSASARTVRKPIRRGSTSNTSAAAAAKCTAC